MGKLIISDQVPVRPLSGIEKYVEDIVDELESRKTEQLFDREDVGDVKVNSIEFVKQDSSEDTLQIILRTDDYYSEVKGTEFTVEELVATLQPVLQPE